MKARRLMLMLVSLLAGVGLLVVSLVFASAVIAQSPAPRPRLNDAVERSGYPLELAAAGSAASTKVASPDAAPGAVTLQKDDGSRENGLVLRDSATLLEFQAILLNHFTVAELAFPFQIEEIHYYAETSNLTGLSLQLLVYEDPDGAPLTNATLIYSETVNVNTQNGWNLYTLATPVVFNSPTDILIGFSTVYAAGGVAWPGDRFPYTMDESDPQGDSYLGWQATAAEPVDVTDLSGLANWLEMADVGFPSNFMIRGQGSLLGSVPAIQLKMTVGADGAVCAPTNSLVVGAGTAVYYCYDVTNTGNVTFTLHDLTDTSLGVLLDDFTLTLSPGASVFLTQSATPMASVVSTATWIAFNQTPIIESGAAMASASAAVTVAAPEVLSCNAPPVGFAEGVPPNWSVTNNAAGNPIFWTSVAGCGEGGNFTGGAGEAACASSDLQGGGAGLYDTELWSNPFSLEAVGQASLTYAANYANFAGVDVLDLDISTDGGGSWTTLLNWNEDHHPSGIRTAPGEAVTVNLVAYVGVPNVIVRWHYYDPSGPASAQDWYAQIDDVALSCTSGPAIDLEMTVGTDSGACADTDTITVPPGADVAYCYQVTNSGTVTLTQHDLVDSELGVILDDFVLSLAPGATLWLTQTANILATTASTATWTAFNPVHNSVTKGAASASDGAMVMVAQPEPVTCNGAAVGFDTGVPPDWTVIVNSGTNTAVEWTSIVGCGEAGNYAGGAGEAACASSDLQGGGLYDTELRLPALDLSAVTTATLSYLANYQNFANIDFLVVGVSIDGGGSWATLLSWNEDHGTFRSAPGESVSLPLNAYVGQSAVLVRWHYYDPAGPAASEDWYVQLDNVALSCASSGPTPTATPTNTPGPTPTPSATPTVTLTPSPSATSSATDVQLTEFASGNRGVLDGWLVVALPILGVLAWLISRRMAQPHRRP